MTIEDLEKPFRSFRPTSSRAFAPGAFDGARFDEKIERDAKAGKLDRLAEQALVDFREGRAREL
jgi:hypothetical protein